MPLALIATPDRSRCATAFPPPPTSPLPLPPPIPLSAPARALGAVPPLPYLDLQPPNAAGCLARICSESRIAPAASAAEVEVGAAETQAQTPPLPSNVIAHASIY
ncbi:hypothetical protein RR46_06830 [Papilio xuthus]|uniref:Uncharacterized protein n=1 Tax=Papilio xuthus TaxID=66420 RepID=A0A194PRM1_PAPXU|nr:hypothetical protein RR46_06830 [Papilio xuthus]